MLRFIKYLSLILVLLVSGQRYGYTQDNKPCDDILARLTEDYSDAAFMKAMDASKVADAMKDVSKISDVTSATYKQYKQLKGIKSLSNLMILGKDGKYFKWSDIKDELIAELGERYAKFCDDFIAIAQKSNKHLDLISCDLHSGVRGDGAGSRSGKCNRRLVKAWEALAKSNLDEAFRRNVDYLDNISKHSTKTSKSADEIVNTAKNNENGVEQFFDELGDTPASGHWDLDPFQRGRNIEDDLGQNLPETFKTLDKYDDVTGEATSIKSIDLDAKTYQNASKLKSRLNKYAKDLDDFTYYSINNVTIGNAARPVNIKSLEVALPRAASGAQLSVINEVIQT